MEIGKTFYAKNRKEWRNWLHKNHKKEKDIWLIYYNKKSGKPRVEYNDAVEEALCYGWIDSIVKNIDEEKFAQRFTPRNPKSKWSESNLERVRRLKKEGKMMHAGLESLSDNHASTVSKSVILKIPSDIKKELMKNKIAWKNFKKFLVSYQKIRIAWIDASRRRPEFFKSRLKYFLKMTEKNKRFGMVQ